MKRTTSFLTLALLWAAPALADPTAQYTIQRAASPIVVDGHLDEFAWEKAEQIDQFERILNNYDQITRPTRAKMLWDDQNIYFAFVCQDPDMWTFLDKEDDELWGEEVVEVFIDPDGDAENYLELEVNPMNVKVDLRIRTLTGIDGFLKGWDIAGLQSAVQVYGTVNDSFYTYSGSSRLQVAVDDSLKADQGWTVEIAIPYSAMADGITGGGAAPKVGDQWRLNLYRIERKAGRQVRAEIVQAKGQKSAHLDSLQKHYEEETEYTAWSETYTRGFHDPSRFGIVKFGE